MRKSNRTRGIHNGKLSNQGHPEHRRHGAWQRRKNHADGALLFAAGAIDRQGRVEDGNTVTDYDAEEIKRKISISAAIAPIDWNQKMLNVIDVPGYFDFVGEMMGPLRVVETAAILVSAVSGIAVGTEKGLDYATKNNVAKCSSSTRWTVTMPTL